MKSFVEIKIKSKLFEIFIVFVFSLKIFGQDCPCGEGNNNVGRVTCEIAQRCSCIIDVSKKVDGRCRPLPSYSSNTRRQKEAQYLSETVGRSISIFELTSNLKLQQALENGKYEENGKVYYFTPFEEVEKSIEIQKDKFLKKDFSPTENRFLKREELDGIDSAIREYKKYLGTPNSTPVHPNFFLNLGKELVQTNNEDNVKKAIEIFKFDAESNQSLESQIELNKAQLQLAISIENIDKNKAKSLLKDVIQDKKATTLIRENASEKLKILEKP